MKTSKYEKYTFTDHFLTLFWSIVERNGPKDVFLLAVLAEYIDLEKIKNLT